MKKYRILIDYSSEGFKFQDEEFETVTAAVKRATEINYGSPFFIVQIIDWEAIEKCPYPDCPRVKYKECAVHGESTNQ